MKKEKLPDKEESSREAEQETEELAEKEIVEAQRGEATERDKQRGAKPLSFDKSKLAGTSRGGSGAPKGEKEIIVEKTPAEKLKETWKPKTILGKKVLTGEITDIDEILDKGKKILEPGVVDLLLPELESDLLLIGQARGKFGGGQRRVFKQTQKKTPEGNKLSFITYGIVGNQNGYIGLGWGKSKETVPARNKAVREAKLNIKKIRRGCGNWLCGCGKPHSIPFKVSGKCGSVIVELKPAPKGKGLIIEEECGKMLKLAGIKDIFCQTKGKTKTKINLVKACFEALKNLMEVKVNPQLSAGLGLIEGKINNE